MNVIKSPVETRGICAEVYQCHINDKRPREASIPGLIFPMSFILRDLRRNNCIANSTKESDIVRMKRIRVGLRRLYKISSLIDDSERLSLKS